MEMALKHKYAVGETVYFTASNVARPAASGTYEVIRLLPTDGDDYGAHGPYLFGAFSAVDAMYAPVVHRFRTYAIDVPPVVRDYMAAMMAHPAFAEWTATGVAENIVIERLEAD